MSNKYSKFRLIDKWFKNKNITPKFREKMVNFLINEKGYSKEKALSSTVYQKDRRKKYAEELESKIDYVNKKSYEKYIKPKMDKMGFSYKERKEFEKKYLTENDSNDKKNKKSLHQQALDELAERRKIRENLRKNMEIREEEGEKFGIAFWRKKETISSEKKRVTRDSNKSISKDSVVQKTGNQLEKQNRISVQKKIENNNDFNKDRGIGIKPLGF